MIPHPRLIVRLLYGGVVAVVLVACSRSRKPDAQDAAVPLDSATQKASVDTQTLTRPPTTASATPHIDAVIPDSVSVQRNSVKEVVIRGSGFAAGAPGRNTVTIGPLRLTQVPANAAGTEIRVVIPDRVVSQSEAPPRPLLPGAYPVTVENSAGTSNAVNVRILP